MKTSYDKKCCKESDNRQCKCKENENKCSNNTDVQKSCGCGHTPEHQDRKCAHEHEHDHKHEREGCGCGHSHGHEDCGCGHDHEHGGEFSTREIFIYIIGAALLVLAFLGELELVSKFVSVPCALVAYVVFGRESWMGLYKNLKQKRVFTEFTLMCAATVGAFALGEFADATAVMYLYSLGEAISGEAYSRSRKNISELIELTEENVTVVKEKNVKTIPASLAEIGDIISVRVGDKISLDGEVVGGNGFADTSSVTGESAPRELSVGSKCYSGSVLISGAIYVKVTEKYENSTASKLKKAVDRALAQKALREKKITRIAGVITPAAFVLFLVVFVAGIFFKDSVAEALRSALVILVASCPCALVLSVPLAYFSGVGRAAKRGIVFKGGQTLDDVRNIETIVLDKTGTLTSSRPEFTGVWLPQNAPFGKTQLLDISKAALLKSPHASARSFCEKYKESVSYKVERAENIGGMGLVCLVDGKKAAFGNRKLMNEIGLEVPGIDKSVIYVALGNKLCGALIFEALLKKNALTEISGLRGNGVKRVAMMSGDTEMAVKSVADEIGVEEYYAELKPDEKLDKLNYIYKEAKKANKYSAVAFCGDGLNDSAAIARADVGIAMGSGSALTVESADVVIVDDNLARLNEMILIAKKTVKVVNQNTALGLGIKIAVVLIGILWFPSLELAVIADVGAAVVSVLNAMRAGKLKK